jgi:aminoglycoside phosphotransferase (APT) family kinase protein
MIDALEDPTDRQLAAWIEDQLCCRITAFERQNRWRPAWYVDATTSSGEQRSLYVRGDRPETNDPDAFMREYRILQVLEAEGIPVPHTYGVCPNPLALVQERSPGRPDLSTAVSDEERASVLHQYMEVLARVHRIDPAKFDGSGLESPEGPQEIALRHFDSFVEKYRNAKRRPEPVLEFLIRWIHRNAPDHRSRVSFLVCDVAQFLFDAGELKVLLDLELAALGDVLQDLAAFQIRDTTEPLGDFAAALRYYEDITGEPIDADAFDFYAVVFATITPVAMNVYAFASLPTSNVLQYLEWWCHGCRWPLEIIAERSEISLPEPEPLAPSETPYEPLAESLVGAINVLPTEGEFARYERDATANLAGFVARAMRYGPLITRQDTTEIEAFFGAEFTSLDDADMALEAFVLAAGPEEDAALVPLLYRRVQRQCELFRPFLTRPSVANRMKTFAQLMAAQ